MCIKPRNLQLILVTCLALGLNSCGETTGKTDHQLIEVAHADTSPIIDGYGNEKFWKLAAWRDLDQNWLGDSIDSTDFNGRYKLAWDKKALYLLVEINDNVYFDQYDDPLKLWWDDDCVEVFVDEDNSGGLHQYSHNAFAYHIALDGNVVDLAPDKEPRLYNDHIQSKIQSEGTKTTWEILIFLYDDRFRDGGENSPVHLESGKKVGFALAYCDNDGSLERENFIGSVFVPGEDKNQGWINADIFGTLILK